MLKKIIKAVLSVVICLIFVVACYVGYAVFSYDRIPDEQVVEIKSLIEDKIIEKNKQYSIVTQNLGFGAYTSDFTFFMDGGTQSWANSKESVTECVNKGADEVISENPDFVLFQEIDTDSTRSYHIDEREILISRFDGYTSTFAVNYHSAFLMYPFYQPHGASNSGIMTFSKYTISSCMRRSLPVSSGFGKFLDLDRCYTVSRLPVDDGKELVLYNVHMSAYGGSDEVRTAQMNMLLGDMKKEYDKGNFCVCGGDFNHDFTGDSTQKLNGGENADFGWAKPFPFELMPEGISRAMNYCDRTVLPTCRNCDVPYKEGNPTFVVDGFLVSDNVTVNYLQNKQTGFVYSDHNPVIMKFTLA